LDSPAPQPTSLSSTPHTNSEAHSVTRNRAKPPYSIAVSRIATLAFTKSLPQLLNPRCVTSQCDPELLFNLCCARSLSPDYSTTLCCSSSALHPAARATTSRSSAGTHDRDHDTVSSTLASVTHRGSHNALSSTAASSRTASPRTALHTCSSEAFGKAKSSSKPTMKQQPSQTRHTHQVVARRLFKLRSGESVAPY
jgi:hypothetical protein